MMVCEVWLARDFLARVGRPIDIPDCRHPDCPPITEERPMSDTATEPACCDLGTNDPTGDEDGIWIAVCKHLLDGNFERFWNDDDDEDDGTPADPAYPVLYVGKTKHDEADELNQLPWQGCANDDCPDTRLCRTHFEAL